MKRGARDCGGDAALRELERALDAFMATHLSVAATALATMKLGDVDGDDTEVKENSPEVSFQRDLKRLRCLSAVVSSTRHRRVASVVSVGRLLLAWLQTVESSTAAAVARSGSASPTNESQSPADPVASWLVATLLEIAFQKSCIAEFSAADRAVIDELVASAVGRCLLAFQRAWQADEEVQRRLRAENSGTLFSYFTMRKAKTKAASSGPPSGFAVCLACTTEAATAWGHVMGLAAGLAPDVSRLKLQKEVLARASLWNASKPSGSGETYLHPYLRHLSHIRVGLAPNTTNANLALASRMADAVRWLRIVMPLLLKPHRSHVRCACAQLVSQMLIRELQSLTRLELSVLYTCTGSDWSRCIGDLHAAALRLTEYVKKKSRSRAQQQLEAASWALRVVVLALAPGEIFARCWHEDALVLLRLQYHLNQDSNAGGASSYNVLPSLELGFTYMMHRHFLLRDSGGTAAGGPSESDCMEIINTTQAWGFFSLPRLRPSTSSSLSNTSSFSAFKTIALPALVHISSAIAAYNTAYTVQSHLRRLLAEPVGIGDPQKLIGLESLSVLLKHRDESGNDPEVLQDFRANEKEILASGQLIGELVGRVLLECSTRIGHKLLTEIPVSTKDKAISKGCDDDDDEDEHGKDPTHAVSVATFAAALGLMPPLYANLALSSEQKLLLLVRASVNAERVVHRRAHETLLSLIGPLGANSPEPAPPGAVTVVRALTDYIMRMSVNNTTSVSDAAGAIIILRLLGVILEPSRATMTRWESPRAKFEALIQVEAIAVYLLARGDDNVQAEQLLRLAALDTLEVAHEARAAYFEQPETRSSNLFPQAGRPSVWTLLKELEPEQQTAFFSFGPSVDNNVSDDHHPLENLHRLIFDTRERQSFRWSLCLSQIFRYIAKRAPDVTAYIWADVADKVAKLEPVIAVTVTATESSQQTQRELARWRNLALLATATANPMLQVQARKAEASTYSESSSPSSSIAPSVAPSSMVASLARQLAIYLRSTNINQRNAAVLALGHAGSTALPTVLDVLARYEGESFVSPFTSEEQESSEASSPQNVLQRSRSTKTTKLSKKKLLEMQQTRTAQLALQWAIGRCYRLLLENRTRDNEDLESGGPVGERLRRASSAFLARLVAAFDGAATAPSESSEASDGSISNPIPSESNSNLLMVQLDFIASLRALILHSNAATKPTLQQLPHDKLAGLLLGWCGSFDRELTDSTLNQNLRAGFVSSPTLYTQWIQQSDVFAARDGGVIFPWIWIDNQNQLFGNGAVANEAASSSRKTAQYMVCHRAFSTLAELLRSSLKTEDGPTSWDGDNVVAWLDACFSVDAIKFPHFADLHQFAQRALHALLELPPGSARFNTVAKRCLEKSICTFPNTGKSQLQVARQYFAALGASAEAMNFFRDLLSRLQDGRGSQEKDEVYLAVQLLHVLLLHVGIHHDDQVALDHRQVALDMVAGLVCAPDADCDDDEAAAARWGLQGYYSPKLEGQVAGRLQVSVSALLAAKFPLLSWRVSLAILRAMPLTPCLERDDITQQRQMLAAVLPWLAEVPLWTPNGKGANSSELLKLLFGITASLGESCSDQLDHIWLTLAFASSGGSSDVNLREIVRFLFRQQQKSKLPSETAKTIVWWLCRWQDAATDVLRLLILQLSLPTTQMHGLENPTALDGLGAIVTLASDTSCHLQQSGGSSSAEVRALVVHLVHVSLTTLFALLDNSTVDELVSKNVTQHCHVLLHSVLPLLEAPRGLLAAALALIQAATSKMEIPNSELGRRGAREQFQESLRALTLCLSAAETQLWSELCVREIALAISTDAPSLESSETTSQSVPPHEVCVRFALVAYIQLAPPFQGDVLLSTLTLLRQTLTAGVDDRSHSLARECLALLSMLTESMPVSRLVLYPQVFWVAFALLTHSRQQRGTTDRTSLLHEGALNLLATLWDRTEFMTHGVAQDLIRGTRPAQWESSTARNSILLEIVRCLYTDDALPSRAQAMEMLSKSVLLLPPDLLGVSTREHLVVCTLGLLPAIAIPLNSEETSFSKSDVVNDLAALWGSSNTSTECDQMVEFLHSSAVVASDQDSTRRLAARFISVFISAILGLNARDNPENLDVVALSLEIFVAILPQPAGSQVPETWTAFELDTTSSDHRGDLIFTLLEEFLREMQVKESISKRAWRPLQELEAALARLLRSPRSERQWRASVRVLTCVAEIVKSSGVAAGPPVSPLPASPTARKSLPGGKLSESPLSPGRSGESDNGIPSLGSPRETADALTLKKSPSLMRVMSSRSRSSDSISRVGSSKANSTANNNDERVEQPSTKGDTCTDQPVLELENHALHADTT